MLHPARRRGLVVRRGGDTKTKNEREPSAKDKNKVRYCPRLGVPAVNWVAALVRPTHWRKTCATDLTLRKIWFNAVQEFFTSNPGSEMLRNMR